MGFHACQTSQSSEERTFPDTGTLCACTSTAPSEEEQKQKRRDGFHPLLKGLPVDGARFEIEVEGTARRCNGHGFSFPEVGETTLA